MRQRQQKRQQGADRDFLLNSRNAAGKALCWEVQVVEKEYSLRQTIKLNLAPFVSWIINENARLLCKFHAVLLFY